MIDEKKQGQNRSNAKVGVGQAVILAAGRGTRMDELTTAIPKAMVELLGKTLLEYKLEALPPEIEEVVVIIGYLGNVIRQRYGTGYNRKKISYVEQRELNGTAGALWDAKSVLQDRFLVLNADDIFKVEDIQRCTEESKGWKLLVQQMDEVHRAGSVMLDESANITGIVEGDLGVSKGLASTNLFALDTRLFSQPMVPKQEGSLEFGLPQTVIAASKNLGIPLEPVFTSDWIQINYPADLVRAAEILKKPKK